MLHIWNNLDSTLKNAKSISTFKFYLKNKLITDFFKKVCQDSISGAPAAEGHQAEPHTHIRELKGTHEMIFSCVPWLAVLLVGTTTTTATAVELRNMAAILQ